VGNGISPLPNILTCAVALKETAPCSWGNIDNHRKAAAQDRNEPAVIGLFGIAPVQFKLVDPSKPAWRRL
jgi:hypothetical protein